jgi:hypothetical protein
MNRGLGTISILIGTAWLVAGVGSAIDRGRTRDLELRMREERTKEITEVAEKAIEAATKKKAAVAKKEDDRVKAAEEKLEAAQAQVDAALGKLSERIAELTAERAEAAADGDTRDVRKIDVALARLEKQQEALVKKPMAQREAAAEDVETAKKRRDEALARTDEAIAAAEKERVEQLEQITSATSSLPQPSPLRAAIACLIGMIFLGLGAMTMVLAKPAKKNPYLDDDVVAWVESSASEPEPVPAAVMVASSEATLDGPPPAADPDPVPFVAHAPLEPKDTILAIAPVAPIAVEDLDLHELGVNGVRTEISVPVTPRNAN